MFCDMNKDITLQNADKKKRRWQILFVDDHGRMMTIKWFKTLSAVVLTALLASILCGIVFLTLLQSTRQDNQKLLEKIDAYKRDIESIRTEKDVLMAKLVIAESKINDVTKENEHNDEAPPTDPAVHPSQKDTDAVAQAEGTGDHRDDDNKDITNGVDIENLVFSHQAAMELLSITFVVKNTNKLSGAVSGYIFVILKPDGDNRKNWFAVPSTGLVSGKPAFPKQGQYFKIKRFKTINFKVYHQKNPETYKQATIFIFSEADNTILLKKTVPVQLETGLDDNTG